MEKYTSEMIEELLKNLVSTATAATMTAEMCGGKVSDELAQAILRDLTDLRTKAMMIQSRMNGWEYAAYNAFLMDEVKKQVENDLRENEET